jgi:hypothetical protein
LARCNSKLRVISSKDAPVVALVGFEPPATFGATKTPKTLLLNPYQLPAHVLFEAGFPTNTFVIITVSNDDFECHQAQPPYS